MLHDENHENLMMSIFLLVSKGIPSVSYDFSLAFAAVLRLPGKNLKSLD